MLLRIRNTFEFWYIIPWPVFDGQASTELHPSMQNSKYGKYQGAWDVMNQFLQIPTEQATVI
jgi:hypothetical protein